MSRARRRVTYNPASISLDLHRRGKPRTPIPGTRIHMDRKKAFKRGYIRCPSPKIDRITAE